jgi:NADH-quinone oxidoreductase subunit D
MFTPETAVKDPAPAQKLVTLNIGPQHPATHGTLRHIVQVDGEIIVKCTPEIGYLHTGFEKLGEHMTFNQFVTVTDRMNYFSALNNNIGWVMAVEEAMGVEITERCRYARVMLLELGRIADHLASAGLSAMDMGAFSVLLWMWLQREEAYNLFEWVTGIRLTNGFARVGGMFKDLPEDFVPRVRKYIAALPETLATVEKMLYRNRIWIERTTGVGVLPPEELVDYGVTGPLLRASGVDYDVRRADPYLLYPDLDFDVITETDGDVFARFRVRIREIRESIKILEQCCDKLPDGPIYNEVHKQHLPPKGDDGKFRNRPTNMEDLIHHFKQVMDTGQMGRHGHVNEPGTEYYSATEAPNGELGWHIVLRGDGRPQRVRVRPPSLINYQAFPAMVEGRLLSDLVATLSSMNIIAGELDR